MPKSAISNYLPSVYQATVATGNCVTNLSLGALLLSPCACGILTLTITEFESLLLLLLLLLLHAFSHEDQVRRISYKFEQVNYK